MQLSELTAFLNSELRLAEIKDYPNAVNGLQVENSGEVTRVAVAVDACEYILRSAVEQGADLLIVHHGLFWSGLQPVTGAAYRKLRIALDGGLAIYSAHLPLDAHPTLGNNALLCDALGLPPEREPFLDLGWKAALEISREELAERLAKAVGGHVHVAPGGSGAIRSVGVVTGGAGGEVFKAARSGVDAFISGEGPHWSYTAAEESGIDLFYGGHYATETFGVKALGALLQERYGLPWQFIDHPTGL
ncbi:MAG: Nif3-like dinuclear metal center hexameric protein [Verrucomicrobia bacterium]|nr:Nif3-like dinuclear metal center hexameric protein [Verrucomicrobiota bacterium]